jgi:hypothetical protein
MVLPLQPVSLPMIEMADADVGTVLPTFPPDDSSL